MRYFRLALVATIVALHSIAASARPPSLQSRCERALGNRAGCVVVYDVASQRAAAVVHPELAYHQALAPGSMMKIVTAAALLEDHAVPPDEKFDCRDRLDLAGRVFTCGVEGGHGPVDMREALARSCSIYFYRLTERLQRRTWERVGRGLGLGAIPWANALRERALNAVGEGAGMALTPWQITQMMAKLDTGSAGLKPATMAVLRDGMRRCVADGTGQPAAVPGLIISGKTGTADVNVDLDKAEDLHPPRPTHGWFSGWTTVGHAHIVVTVFLTRGTGHDAATLAGKIFRLCAN